MNLPFFKFYPRDWMGDTQLRMVSIAARGLWFECLCIMHSAKRRGYLETQLGQPINDEMLARLSGTFKDDLYRLKDELLSNGIPSVEETTGVWFNRRMVKDTEKSDKCADAGKRGGGNPTLSNQSPSHSLSNTDSREERTDNQIPDTRSHISLKVPFKGECKGKGKVEGKAPRARNELIDALAECDGDPLQIPSSAWGRIAKALAEIKAVCPDVTPDEIRRRAANYKTHMGTAVLTSTALVKHWARCDKKSDSQATGKNTHTPGFVHPNSTRAQERYCNGELIPIGGDADVCEQA